MIDDRQQTPSSPGELAYWVRFDEPQYDADSTDPYRKALIWARYLRTETE